MNQQINSALDTLESHHHCRLLFSCESGSRAWGFASPDSDYDVRMIYVHSLDWYLQLQEGTDSIDQMLPGDLDLSGWDLRKTLRLFAGCNLGLNEWLGSPIIYRDIEGLKKRLQALIPQYFNPKQALFHYLSMAKKVSGAVAIIDVIRIKKLFYVLRALFACRWIAVYQTMPPTAFEDLWQDKALATSAIREAVQALLIRKHISQESTEVSCPVVLSAWLTETMTTIESQAKKMPASKTPGWDALDALFMDFLRK